jgi:hypothetical protein
MAVDLDVLEDRRVLEFYPPEVDPGCLQQRQFVGRRRQSIDPDQAPDPQSQTRRRERAVGRGAAQPPAPRVVVCEVARRDPDDQQVERRGLSGR